MKCYDQPGCDYDFDIYSCVEIPAFVDCSTYDDFDDACEENYSSNSCGYHEISNTCDIIS